MTEQPPAAAVSWNQQVIEEFRANGGAVGGMFEGASLLLLTTQGAKSGKPHTTPVVYLRDGSRLLVFASNNGSRRDPQWYRNLLADARAGIEIGAGDGRVAVHSARARPLAGEERDRFYALQAERSPAFRDYEARASRTIPVVALTLLELSADPEQNHAVGEQLLRAHDQLRSTFGWIRAEIAEVVAGRAAAEGTGRSVPDLRRQLLRHCSSFCYGMEMHHISEDGAFTAVEARFPELTEAVARLRREHREVAATLARIEGLLASLDADAEGELGGLWAELEGMVASVEEHFAYEEERLLPVLGFTP
jgi:deazaflavin-dependent oxidoreductase (nitroreductase family)